MPTFNNGPSSNHSQTSDDTIQAGNLNSNLVNPDLDEVIFEGSFLSPTVDYGI